MKGLGKSLEFICMLWLVWLSSPPDVAMAQRDPQPFSVSRANAENAAHRPQHSGHYRHMLEDAELNDVFFVDTQRGWAVGDRGAIWHTADGGHHWRLQPSGVACRLESIHFIDSRTGWAVGGTIRPWSHRTDGVVLRTLDGGRRWTQIPRLTLPQLKRIKFLTRMHGWAVGSPSTLYPSGIFQTSDGGRSWSPVAADTEDWICADFRDRHSGAAAGHRGALSVVFSKGAIQSRTPSLGMRSIRDLQLAGKTGGWLVGDGGLVMTTIDGGLTWQLPSRSIPPVARHEFNYIAVATFGSHVWIAGSPGTLILHSPDGGRSWDLQPTGHNGSLRAIHFVDEQHGWAVGSQGAILTTSNGGKTWRMQHAGGSRASVLFVLSDASEIPWEAIARLGGEEGYLCISHVIGRRDQQNRNGYVAAAEDRLLAASSFAGGSGASQAWQFPLRENQLQLSKNRIIAGLNTAHDGRGMSELQSHLTRLIRQWQPDLVITHGRHEDEYSDEQRLLASATIDAVAHAADSTMFPQQLSAARLQPWSVKKVFAICPPEVAGDVSVTTSSLAMRLGSSLAEIASPARSLISNTPLPARPLIEFRLVKHNITASGVRRDFLSGINTAPGSDSRRALGDIPPGDLTQLRRLAQRQRNVEQLIASSKSVAVDDDAFLGQINELTYGLNDEAASRLIFQLGARYQRTGRPDLAAQSFQIVAQRFRTQPAADEAMTWLITNYASAEAAWRNCELTSPHVRPARVKLPLKEKPTSQIAPVAFDEPLNPQPSTSSTSNQNTPQRPRIHTQAARALALHKLLQQTRPSVAADSRLQLATASIIRDGSDPRAAEAIYRRTLGLGVRDTWSNYAKGELWLKDPRVDCPLPLVHCAFAKNKPFLDGRLDEPFWQQARPLPLRSPYQEDQAWPAEVKLAYDEQFLYLAVRCRRATDADYPPEKRTRPRDADLANSDRVELLLDVNRDYSTAYALTIDYRGWTADSIGQDIGWNPDWFVASWSDQANWYAEAAIPLLELGPSAPQARQVWAVGARRIVPRVGLQGWTRTTSAETLDGIFGLMMFE